MCAETEASGSPKIVHTRNKGTTWYSSGVTMHHKRTSYKRDVGSGQGVKNQDTSGDGFLGFGDDVAPGWRRRRRRRRRAHGDTRRTFHARVQPPEAAANGQRAHAHAHDARRAGRRSRGDSCNLPARGGHRPRHARIHHHRHRYPKTFNPCVCVCISPPFAPASRSLPILYSNWQNPQLDWKSARAELVGRPPVYGENGDRGIAGRATEYKPSPPLGYGVLPPSVAMAFIP